MRLRQERGQLEANLDTARRVIALDSHGRAEGILQENTKVAAEPSSRKRAHDWLVDLVRLPHVRATIHAEQSRMLETELAALALQCLKTILEDPRDDKDISRIKLEASKTVLDRAGHVVQKAATPRQHLEDLVASLTAAELRDLLEVAAEQLMSYGGIKRASLGVATRLGEHAIIDLQPEDPAAQVRDPDLSE